MNRDARSLMRAYPPVLDKLQKRIVQDVERVGIAVTSLEELFPSESYLKMYQKYIAELPEEAGQQNKKSFLRHYWTTNVALAASNPFLQFALNPRILSITNTYMGMWTRLKHYTVNRAIPDLEHGNPTFSQKWHRDPQEKRMIKAFIYLSDVNEDTGPFTYITESTHGKKYGALFPQKPPLGSYPPAEEVEKKIDPKNIRVMTGKAGTVLFCDTTGIHRGGFVRKGERLMFTSFYPAPSYVDTVWYSTPPEFDYSSYTREAVFALHHS